MKKFAFYFSMALCLALALPSCKGDGKSVFTPSSSGRPYEVLVVMDKNLWEEPAGRALYNVLDTDVPGLPQSERSFRISQIPPDRMQRSFKIFRNIIMTDIQPNVYTQPKLKYSRNPYAVPQMVLTIQAPDTASFASFVTKHGQTIIDFFTKTEMNREINRLKKEHSPIVSTKVGSIFGCEVFVPMELQKYKQEKDFFWASTDRATSDMNFVMYSYPYTDKNTFTKEYFIHKRDSVMKANLPGAREGMYMTTADSMFVDTKNINVKGEYAFEARGLWEMEGDMMGGPFVSHARVDRPNGRVVVVEAFIFSPNNLKRDLMRRMEASLYTLALPQEQQIEEIVVSPEVTEEVPDSTKR